MATFCDSRPAGPRTKSKMSGLLEDLCPTTELWNASDGVLEVNDLWNALKKIAGIGNTTAAKLLARKRPRLCPLTDSVVRKAVNVPGSTWNVLQRLTEIRQRAPRSTTSAQPQRLTQACCASSTSPSGCCTVNRRPPGRHEIRLGSVPSESIAQAGPLTYWCLTKEGFGSAYLVCNSRLLTA